MTVKICGYLFLLVIISRNTFVPQKSSYLFITLLENL